ncbi:MAG: c-type cytochrome [Phycisphaeraceae bacterium]|nr:MAG: c-type cytochrome [Phycisphaeraceae bacterium]
MGSNEPAVGRGVAPAPVLTPEESIARMTLPAGYRVEVFAAEPMVEAPVSMAFDERGRLWIVEMVGYMPDAEGTGETTPNGRVAVLEDTDGDGKADRRTVFMEGLVLPRGVMPCHGGALVIAPPDLIFARDTDGDGRADERRVVATGFGGIDNPEHAGNAPLRGIDNWVHFSQHHEEFAFDGERADARPTPAHGQWGMSMDDAGRLYYVPNSDTLRADLFPKHYAGRGSAPGLNELIGRDAAVWPLVPTPGVNRGYQPGTLRADGTLATHTAACGPAVYRASLLGNDARGDVFTCEPAAFMVRRLHVTAAGVRLSAANAYERAEFLRSDDERFRPVWASVGPEGALYIADMHRGVIQHRTYATQYLKGHIRERGLERPLHAGRVYRVVPDGYRGSPRVELGSLGDADLVGLLAHADGWWRDTAQRLLVERRAAGQRAALAGMAVTHGDPLARLHALWTLDGLGMAEPGDARAALSDGDERVRSAGLRIAERWIDDPAHATDVRGWVERALNDASDVVRVTAALSAGRSREAWAVRTLVPWACSGRSEGLGRTSALLGARGREAEFARALLALDASDAGVGFEGVLGSVAGRVFASGSPEEARWLLSAAVMLHRIGDPAGRVITDALRGVQNLGGSRPRTVELATPPAGWLGLIGDAGHPASARLAESDVFLAWPGRPARGRDAAPFRPLTDRERQRYRRGEVVYVAAGCAGCHGGEGQGVVGQIPPLAGSDRVLGSPARLARILMQGMQGPISTPSGEYNGVMPGAPIAHDGDLASLMTFLRRAWGNEADPVGVDLVEAQRRATRGRTEPWRSDEIDGLK